MNKNNNYIYIFSKFSHVFLGIVIVVALAFVCFALFACTRRSYAHSRLEWSFFFFFSPLSQFSLPAFILLCCFFYPVHVCFLRGLFSLPIFYPHTLRVYFLIFCHGNSFHMADGLFCEPCINETFFFFFLSKSKSKGVLKQAETKYMKGKKVPTNIPLPPPRPFKMITKR